MTDDKKTDPIEFRSVVAFPDKNISNVVSFLGTNSISKYIVLEGNLSMGWIAFGPFNSLEDAGFFANLRDEMTWIMELHDAEPPQKPAMAQ